MFEILVIILLFGITIFMSKNNFKSRSDELKANLKEFNLEIKNKFYSMPEDKQKEFLSLLNPEWKVNFESILSNNFNYAANAWALQQQIAKQQELFIELDKYANK
ncbi:hypothetical protein [Clostridium aciditolerans]|uniref:Uncharacterized protein n=1 Tax=Clostridium aciditolerans TaxID=339861 RepID=A0A934M685_9CLOT|nr:hypothetical protein [Clostridium aciditolerans]MBI6872806.1 hypothetical protein [Clostridium aciditolerans]